MSKASKAVLVSAAVVAAGFAAQAARSGAAPDPVNAQQAQLVARSVLASSTVRPASPPSGEFFSAADRATAAGNGVAGPATGAYFAMVLIPGEGRRL